MRSILFATRRVQQLRSSCEFCHASPITGPTRDDVLDKIRPASYLGFGGTGKVIAATYLPDGSRVAVKIISITADTREARVREARNEVESLKKVHEQDASEEALERIVRPKEVGWSFDTVTIAPDGRMSRHRAPDGQPQLVAVYPLVAGKELYDLIRQGPMPEQITKYYMRRLVESMDVCHAAGVAHRDLKPDNIMVSQIDRDVRIIDFGMAAIASSTRGVRSTVRQALLNRSPSLSPQLCPTRFFACTATQCVSTCCHGVAPTCRISLIALHCRAEVRDPAVQQPRPPRTSGGAPTRRVRRFQGRRVGPWRVHVHCGHGETTLQPVYRKHTQL